MRCYEQIRNGPLLHRLPVRIVGIGGGVKIFFQDWVGLRFEGRLFATELDEDDDSVFCGRHDPCRHFHEGDYFEQAEVRLGLTLKF